MKATILEGEQSWLGHIDAEPVMLDFDSTGCVLRLETQFGDLVIRLEAGEHDTIDVDRLRTRIEELFAEDTV